jgi:hypothetical protein
MKNLKSILFKGFTLGAAVTLLIVAADIIVLGPLMGYVALPRFESVRLINIAGVFTRMDILYAFILIVLRFFKYASCFTSVRCFSRRSSVKKLCALRFNARHALHRLCLVSLSFRRPKLGMGGEYRRILYVLF